MKKKMLRRTTLREIRGSMGRFLAILAIVALGVGFFCGVRITTPAMVNTMDRFWQEKQLYDYRLISTLGWEEDDVARFAAAEGVRDAEGSHTLDLLCHDKADNEFVLKAHSITKAVNLLTLTEGRMPTAGNECIMDAGMPGTLRVGDTVYIADGNEEDTLDALSHRAYTIVGAAHSSLYANFERGTTSLGNGSVSGYLYLPEDAWDVDYYSEIYVRFDADDVIYSKAYKDAMDARDPVWEQLTQTIAERRYDRLVADAQAELDDGRAELADKRAEGQQELDDAAQELADGKQKLDDAKEELADAEQELADAKKELDDAAKELADAKEELDSGELELADAKQQIEDGQATLDDSEAQLLDGEAQISDGQAQIDAAAASLAENEAMVEAQAQVLEGKAAELAQALTMLDYLSDEQRQAVLAGQAEVEAGRVQIEQARAGLAAGRRELEAQQSLLDEKRAELADGWAQLEQGRADLADAQAQYDEGLAKWQDGKQAYEDGVKEYEDGLAKYEDGVKEYEDGKAEYADGVKDYEDGLAEYEDGKAEFDEKIADAEADIADAQQKIDDIDAPDTFVLDRGTNISYACFESDSQIVEQVARVFPIFFILVAALVCLTTMSRMVEEQRTQIGTLKALGYSEGDIMGKYMFYSGLAAVLGCVIGYAVGIVLFPTVIWRSYQLMYIPLRLHLVIDWGLAAAALGVSLLGSLGVTWISCRLELAETAAGLMRPKAPKAGKRVLLEHVPFIWDRLKFLHKVSIRNIFRYKGRFFMMVIGISGCTALLLTGFGLKDSVAGFADVQYGEIVTADASVVFKSDIGDTLPPALTAKLDAVTADYTLLHEASWDLVTKDKTKGMSVLVPLDGDAFADYMTLRTLDGDPLSLPADGEALVCNAIAERYGAVPGETILLRDEDMRELRVKVAGVFENHVYNYIILSPGTLASQLGEPAACNAAYLHFPEDADPYQAAATLAQEDKITTVSLFDEIRIRMGNMMKSLDLIVLVVILCAAGLAFIVLYDLTNINITERIREIATIKVLGFFRSETSAYVLRENLALTAVGTVCGLFLGIALHRFVIAQIIVDLVSFRVRILPLSFVWSVLLTIGFDLIVDLFMGLKLDRINMAESLKSVE